MNTKAKAPGSLKYAHFEVEVGRDGLPLELGAGAMAVALVHRSDFGIWRYPSKDVFALASEITQAVTARIQPGHRPDETETPPDIAFEN